MTNRTTVSMFGAKIDAIRMPVAVARLWEWIAEPCYRCRYVVTPNVDHTVMLSESEPLRNVYGGAAMVLADGWPVVTAARLMGRPVPERVAGSDLVPSLLASASEQRTAAVFLLGGMPGVPERAAANILGRWPTVKIVGTYSPPFGFEHDPTENEQIISMINQARPDVLVIGLGAPKQELWIHTHRKRLRVKVALCVGATIDFLAGEKKRAPVWARALRMEWLHRLLSEPRRLAKRYARDAWKFPQLVLKEWWRGGMGA